MQNSTAKPSPSSKTVVEEVDAKVPLSESLKHQKSSDVCDAKSTCAKISSYPLHKDAGIAAFRLSDSLRSLDFEGSALHDKVRREYFTVFYRKMWADIDFACVL